MATPKTSVTHRLLAAAFVLLLVVVSVLMMGCQPRPKYTAACVHKPTAVRAADRECPNRTKGFVWFYIPDRYSVPGVGRKIDLTRGSWTKPGSSS